jgi:hypothetical protein
MAPAVWPVPSRAAPSPGDPPGSFAYRRSTDGGSTFTAGQLDDRDRDLTTTQLEVEAGVVHALFEDNTETGPGGDNDRAVYYRRSTDGGKTYTASERIDDNTGDSSESDIAASGGDVFVVWEDDRLLSNGDPDPAAGDVGRVPPEGEAAYSNRDDVFFTRSGQGGSGFGPPLNLSCEAEARSPDETSADDPTPERKRCDSDEIHNRDPRIAASPDGRTVVVAYEANDIVSGPESSGDFTKDDDVLISASDDGGRTWKVRNHNVSDAAERQTSPAVEVSDTAVHLVYQNQADRAAETTNRSVQYTRSLDGGVTFEKVRTLPGPNIQSSAVRAEGRTVHVVACEEAVRSASGSSSEKLLYWQSPDDGESWTGPVTLAGHAEGCSAPDVDAAGGGVHVVYEAQADPLESDIFYVRSENAGKRWSKRVNLAHNALASSAHPTVTVDPAAPGNLFVGWSDQANLLMSLAVTEAVPGDDGPPLVVADEDVVRYRGGSFTVVLDGSDVGLEAFAIDALARTGEKEFILSFSEPALLGTLGLVDDADLVRFTADRLGPDTAGTFDLFFDGSDIGLSEENVDALEVVTHPGGVDLYLSTAENFAVEGGLQGSASDVFICTGAATGDESRCGGLTAGFDGGGSGRRLRVDAFSFDGTGVQPGEDAVAFFSFNGAFDAGSASGDGSDVAVCQFENLGPSADGRVLRDCGGSVPLRAGLQGEPSGIAGEITAVEADY